MTTFIGDGSVRAPVDLLTGWESTKTAGNVLHSIIGVSTVEVTLRDAGLRTGSLEFVCSTLDEALDFEHFLAQDKVLTLEDDDHPSLNMTFVAAGAITLAIDDETRDMWIITIDFQEVSP